MLTNSIMYKALVDKEHYNSLIAEVAPTPAPTATVATTPVTV